jgi:hypothetical protein
VTRGLLAGLGAASGIVAWALLRALDADIDALGHSELPITTSLSTVPGLVFGVAFGAVLLRVRGTGVARVALYALAAGIAYFAAFHAAYFSFLLLPELTNSETLGFALAGIAGGLTGSVLLGLASTPLLQAPAAQVLGRPVVVGSLAGGTLELMMFGGEGHAVPLGLLGFFALWQGAYAASLAPLLQPARVAAGASRV